MATEIYILRDDEKKGPYTEEEIRSQLVIGIIKLEDQVWWDGLPAWKALGETELLKGGIKEAPDYSRRSSADEPDFLVKPPTSAWAIITLVLAIVPFGFPFAIYFGLKTRDQLLGNMRMGGLTMVNIGLILALIQPLVLIGLLTYDVLNHQGVHEDDPYATSTDTTTDYSRDLPPPTK